MNLSTPSIGTHSPPREEGWLRHQQIFGVANFSAADGVVAYEQLYV